jgi:hypothetical protein
MGHFRTHASQQMRAIRSASSARSASDEGMVKSGYRPALELMTS